MFGVPLHLPYESLSPAGTPLARRPQRFSLATQLRFTQQLLATLLPELEIHHLVHPQVSSFESFAQAVSGLRRARPHDHNLRQHHLRRSPRLADKGTRFGSSESNLLLAKTGSKSASVGGRPLARIHPLGHIRRHKAFWTRSTRSSSEPSPCR